MYKVILSVIFGFWVNFTIAQELRFFMPEEIQNAYENSTRSYDGKPGSDYWQNFVDYSINVEVFPSEKLIKGHVKAEYKNNSPDKIDELVVRLYADVYKKGTPRLFGINPEDITEGVKLSDVSINGHEYDLEDRQMVRRSNTLITFSLPNTLDPGENLSFEASWEQKIPYISRIRTGAYDSTTFFIAYWYPQISVYDDVFGWDKLDYTLLTEFYNNLSDFDVKITVPENFVVWATGTLSNARDILPSGIYEKYKKAQSSESTISLITYDDLVKGFKAQGNTWHYTAKEVPDFAFAVSDHYQWDAATQKISGRDVLVNSVFPIDTSGYYSDHVDMQRKIMRHLSDDIPGIPYPYESFTTFITLEGSGGMEYPMMANNGYAGRGVTIHEIFHTYLPMYVRTNEKRWSWMDEGWADFNTTILGNKYFDGKHDIVELFSDVTPAGGITGTTIDLPLIVSSEFITLRNFRFSSYSLPSFIYTILYQYLGEEVFLNCYREYIRRWAKKSPTPYDFFYTFEDVSEEDLAWLWKPWFFEFGKADVAIESFDGNLLKIVNLGNKPVPVIVRIYYEDGKTEMRTETAEVWKDGNSSINFKINNPKKVEKISVNTDILDADLRDNYYPGIPALYKGFEISDSCIGNFILEEYQFKYALSKKNGMLYLKLNRGVNLLLYPIEKDKFKSLNNSIEIELVYDTTGECTGFNYRTSNNRPPFFIKKVN